VVTVGPGLGVVEPPWPLTRLLDLDIDRVAWDVGHQAYPKLITGRYSQFSTRLRKQGRVAGYLKRCPRAASTFSVAGACLHQHFGGPGHGPGP